MSKAQVIEVARLGVFSALAHLKEAVDALDAKRVVEGDFDDDAFQTLALDAKDAYTVFAAAAQFHDIALNQ
jgi:hypothetical protein